MRDLVRGVGAPAGDRGHHRAAVVDRRNHAVAVGLERHPRQVVLELDVLSAIEEKEKGKEEDE